MKYSTALSGKKLPQFVAELSGQGFVVGQHQGGLANFVDDPGNGVGFAGAGGPPAGSGSGARR